MKKINQSRDMFKASTEVLAVKNSVKSRQVIVYIPWKVMHKPYVSKGTWAMSPPMQIKWW